MPQLLKFNTPYKNLSPDTIFLADSGTRTLQPFGSAEALTERGFNFGQVETGAPDAFGDYGLGGVINSRSQSLAGVKDELNQFQNSAFNQASESKKRASSVLEDSINADQKSLDDALAEYKGLKDKLGALTAPNYQQAYTDLRTTAGVPALEQQFTDTRATRRELPYTERANTGNAAVATEAQLGAQTAEKDIPLGIKEANLIDRLQLASDFVNNSLKFKQMDSESARSSITDAASLLADTINMTRTHLSDLTAKKDKEQNRQDQALQFRLENNISTPMFNVGGTIYDSGSLEGIPDEETFQERYGMTLQDAVAKGLVTTISGEATQDKALALDLASKYPDAGILTSDTFAKASAKLKNSRIYQEQVRPPASAGGGSGGGGVLGLSNQQIDNISPLVTQFQNSPIVQNYNTIGEGYKFATSLSNKTTNPADDQALIYALAKALDPGSVVREGEYATVQKYAQSLVQSYGKSVSQALSGTGFLSEDARTNIKATIKSRFKAAESSYNNLYSETARRVNLVGGTDKGNQLLTNYGGAFAQPSTADFVGPMPAGSAPAPKEEKGFWSSVGNWLFGSD
jgi:hypothetical protein